MRKQIQKLGKLEVRPQKKRSPPDFSCETIALYFHHCIVFSPLVKSLDSMCSTSQSLLVSLRQAFKRMHSLESFPSGTFSLHFGFQRWACRSMLAKSWPGPFRLSLAASSTAVSSGVSIKKCLDLAWTWLKYGTVTQIFQWWLVTAAAAKLAVPIKDLIQF